MKNEFLIIDTAWANSITIAGNFGIDIFEEIPHTLHRHYGNPVAMEAVEKAKFMPGRKILLLDSWDFDRLGEFYHSNFDFSFADLIIFISAELSGQGYEYYKKLSSQVNNDNCIFITAGYDLMDNPMPSTLMHYDFYWVNRVLEVNEPKIYDTTSPRKYLFDVLLGSKKWFRNSIFNSLAHLNLINSSLISLHDSHCEPHLNPIPSFESPELMSLENEHVLNFKTQAKTELDRYSGNTISGLTNQSGFGTRMSCVVSEKIYENSWYSIVAETNFDTNVLFLSEKTAKAMFARRVFVMFATVNHLKWLRELGFKTFDGIIDESYDSIANPSKRLAAAMQQVLYLSNLDPVAVYAEAKPIIEHNFALALSLRNKNYESIRDFIKPHLDKLR